MTRLTIIFLASILIFSPGLQAKDRETVAVIGTGDMGDSLGPRFAELGYRVIYGSRKPESEKVQNLVAMTGHGASAATQKEAARQGDIVLTLVPWPPMEHVAQNLGDLTGKIIIDVSMPFKQGEDGYPELILETSSAEMIQGWNPGARVVKAFATLGSQVIDNPSVEGGPVSVPIASDHPDAKIKVARIIADMGLDPIDFGPLRMSRYIETMQMVYMIPLVQERHSSWEFYFRRSNYWKCEWGDGLYDPIYDKGKLADFPKTQGEDKPCS